MVNVVYVNALIREKIFKNNTDKIIPHVFNTYLIYLQEGYSRSTYGCLMFNTGSCQPHNRLKEVVEIQQ